jgi:tRNA pseudouridine55 synthase
LADAGVLIVDKASGMTSHDVVAKARKTLGTREIGHAGTLDPMATGVLVLAIGDATKLVPYLSASDKEYEATIALGVTTDTLDADGKETSRVPVPPSWTSSLDAALDEERKRTMQLPPIFSAIHAKGARSHELARRGEAVELDERPVRVVSLDLTATHAESLDVRMVVSKGFYVRALARDLAARLGTVGHLTALRRVRSGTFTLADAGAMIPLVTAATRVLPTATLTEMGVLHARAGRRVPLDDLGMTEAGEHAWLAPDGALVAIGRIEDGSGKVTRGFRY